MTTIFCGFVLNATAYHFGRYEPSSPSTKELHVFAKNASNVEPVNIYGLAVTGGTTNKHFLIRKSQLLSFVAAAAVAVVVKRIKWTLRSARMGKNFFLFFTISSQKSFFFSCEKKFLFRPPASFPRPQVMEHQI